MHCFIRRNMWKFHHFFRIIAISVDVFCADSQEENVSYIAFVSIACKPGAVAGRAEMEAEGQQFLTLVTGFLRARPPPGKVHEVLRCSPGRADFIVSLRPSSYHKLLQCWANPSEAEVLNTYCASMSFTASCDTPVLSISGKLGSDDWLFPWQRCNSGGMFAQTILSM